MKEELSQHKLSGIWISSALAWPFTAWRSKRGAAGRKREKGTPSLLQLKEMIKWSVLLSEEVRVVEFCTSLVAYMHVIQAVIER